MILCIQKIKMKTNSSTTRLWSLCEDQFGWMLVFAAQRSYAKMILARCSLKTSRATTRPKDAFKCLLEGMENGALEIVRLPSNIFADTVSCQLCLLCEIVFMAVVPNGVCVRMYKPNLNIYQAYFNTQQTLLLLIVLWLFHVNHVWFRVDYRTYGIL